MGAAATGTAGAERGAGPGSRRPAIALLPPPTLTWVLPPAEPSQKPEGSGAWRTESGPSGFEKVEKGHRGKHGAASKGVQEGESGEATQEQAAG